MIKKPRQGNTKQVRNNNARVTYHDRSRHLLFQLQNVEFHPDGKHKEADADLTKQPEWFERGGGKDKLKGRGSNPPKERRPEQNTGNHFAYHSRLTHTSSYFAGQSRCGDDDENLEQQTTKRARAILPEAALCRGKEISAGWSGMLDLCRRSSGRDRRREVSARLQDEENGQAGDANYNEIHLCFTFHVSIRRFNRHGGKRRATD